MWSGKTVAILGSGPSMSKDIATAVARANIPSVVINTTFRLAPFADILYAADHSWWQFYHGQVNGFAGTKVTCSPEPITPLPFADVMMLRMTGKGGFDSDPSCIRSGCNSGYQGIHIAMHAGAQRILLCGFDLRGTHWHGYHPSSLRNAGEDVYLKWKPYFEELGPIAKGMGVEILNCTPGSALKCFPMAQLGDVL